ncbi:hypothetical protein [Lutispora saccharofermentans]|uniref:Uncharacterized protein n=1 Tax=Lutispora saccharofermentans TaxID=3024236 RepID=A0ABT1NBY8_9FIRM|nr:hypothetical protein [Lutispora saccharofermentans]MCQ1528780.1 hypothetical protein [Lutispora saccharofermentans]
MKKKNLMFVALLLCLSLIFAYYSNMPPNISINCYLEYTSTSEKKPDKKYFIININTKVSDFQKYKSIDIDYVNRDNYGAISNYIIAKAEDRTEKGPAFKDYANNIEITLIPERLNYDKIKEMLKDEFITIELETINGYKHSKKYSIGEILKDKTDVLELGQVIKEHMSLDNKEVVARANGIEIYKDEVEMYKKLYSIDGTIKDSGSYADVIGKRAKIKVLYEMAEDNGLDISIEEAKALSLKEKEAYDQELEEEGKAFMEDYIKALGLTEEQYWSDFRPGQIQLYYSIENLKNSFIKEGIELGILPEVQKTENKIIMSPDINKKYREYWESKIKDIEEGIEIEIISSHYQ